MPVLAMHFQGSTSNYGPGLIITWLVENKRGDISIPIGATTGPKLLGPWLSTFVLFEGEVGGQVFVISG